MTKLYEGRLIKKLSTADAVRVASRAVLRQRRAKGLSAHLFHWAAFVAAGDWRSRGRLPPVMRAFQPVIQPASPSRAG